MYAQHTRHSILFRALSWLIYDKWHCLLTWVLEKTEKNIVIYHLRIHNELFRFFKYFKGSPEKNPKNPYLGLDALSRLLRFWKFGNDLSVCLSNSFCPKRIPMLHFLHVVFNDLYRVHKSMIIPLNLQMEDRAIEELDKFYNVQDTSDEIISIERVDTGAVASPLWVPKTKWLLFYILMLL